MVYARPAYRPMAGPVAPPAPARALSEREAIGIAHRIARDRGLDVDRVTHSHLDGSGRWHVELRGRRDRARLLLDGRDGRLLKGRFKEKGDRREDDEDWDD